MRCQSVTECPSAAQVQECPRVLFEPRQAGRPWVHGHARASSTSLQVRGAKHTAFRLAVPWPTGLLSKVLYPVQAFFTDSANVLSDFLLVTIQNHVLVSKAFHVFQQQGGGPRVSKIPARAPGAPTWNASVCRTPPSQTFPCPLFLGALKSGCHLQRLLTQARPQSLYGRSDTPRASIISRAGLDRCQLRNSLRLLICASLFQLRPPATDNTEEFKEAATTETTAQRVLSLCAARCRRSQSIHGPRSREAHGSKTRRTAATAHRKRWATAPARPCSLRRVAVARGGGGEEGGIVSALARHKEADNCNVQAQVRPARTRSRCAMFSKTEGTVISIFPRSNSNS